VAYSFFDVPSLTGSGLGWWFPCDVGMCGSNHCDQPPHEQSEKKCWEEKKCVKIWTHMDADFYTPFSHFGVFVTISTENESVKV